MRGVEGKHCRGKRAEAGGGREGACGTEGYYSVSLLVDVLRVSHCPIPGLAVSDLVM